MSYDDRLDGYNDVASRMREFFERYPHGRLRPAGPWRIETIGDRQFVVYEAAAYRTHDDPLPGVGVAWEPFPGRTPYTKDSELMNAETSAWGRAILAVGAADTRKGIASREEVRNRQADRDQADPEQARRNILANARAAIDAADLPGLPAIEQRIDGLAERGAITPDDLLGLAALLDARRAHLAAEQPDPPADDQAQLDGEWPDPAKPADPG